MDANNKIIQRLYVAQELVQSLVNALMLPSQPDRAYVQTILEAAAAKLKAIEAQPSAPIVPLVIPQLVPAAAAIAAAVPPVPGAAA